METTISASTGLSGKASLKNVFAPITEHARTEGQSRWQRITLLSVLGYEAASSWQHRTAD